MSKFDEKSNRHEGSRGDRLSLSPDSLGYNPEFKEVETGSVFRWDGLEWKTTSVEAVEEPRSGFPIFHYQTLSGTFPDAANANLNGNYSAAPVDFIHTATEDYLLDSVTVTIVSNGNMMFDGFGNLPALANGARLFLKLLNPPSTPEIPAFSGLAIKHNYQWHCITDATIRKISLANGDKGEILKAKNDFTQDYGAPFLLNKGDKLIYRLNDDLTGLVWHTISLRGIQLPSASGM